MAVSGPLTVCSAAVNPEGYIDSLPENQKNQIEDSAARSLARSLGEDTEYISEIMIGTGNSEREAKQAIIDKGFKVYDQNLNQRADDDAEASYDEDETRACAYIGYKTTKDREAAITSLRIMDQNGGYDTFNYREHLQNKNSNINQMAAEFKNAVFEFKENYDAGKPNALIAAKYLDLFCVPDTSSSFDGVDLITYLTDPARTMQDYSDFLLLLNPSVLNAINAQLTMASIDSDIIETDIIGTDNEGVPVTSRTGVIGYSGMESDDDWLREAASALIGNETITGDDEEYKSDLVTSYLDQIILLRQMLAEGFSDSAITYLNSYKLQLDIKLITGNTELNIEDCSIMDFLNNADDLHLSCFLNALPDVCKPCHFTDVIEICANDAENRIPSQLEVSQKYRVDWIDRIVANTTELPFDIYDEEQLKENEEAINAYSYDISTFISLLKTFFADYDEAAAIIDTDGIDFFSLDKQAAKERKNGSINEDGTVDKPNAVYYVGAYEFLNLFSMGEGKTFATYLRDIVRESEAGTDEGTARANALTYFIIRSMTEGQKYAYKSCSLLNFLLFSALTDKDRAALEDRVPTLKAELMEGLDYERFSVWIGTNKEFLETEYLAVTSAEARRKAADTDFGELMKNDLTLSDNVLNALQLIGYSALAWVGIALGALMIGAKVMGISLVSAICTGAAAFSGMSCLASAGAILCSTGVAVVIFLVVLLVVALVLFFVWLFAKDEDTPEYTAMPTIMVDSKNSADGYSVQLLRYDLVKNQNGEPVDINCFQGKAWNALYYSKDEIAGSPLVANSEGEFFGSRTGSTKIPPDAFALRKFGYRESFNLNTHCYSDNCNGLYLWYYTEDSLRGINPEEVTGKYISGLTIAVSDNLDAARNAILALENYNLINYDLTPDHDDYYMFIGYKTTNSIADAVKDIRVAYGSTSKEIHFGKASYASILPEGNVVCPLQTCEPEKARRKDTDFSYSVYCSYSMGTAGQDSESPAVLAGSLKAVTSLSEVPDGAEVVSLFAGSAFDFNSWDKEDKDSFDSHVFLYYETDKPFYKSAPDAKEYLAGIAFFSGSTDWLDGDDCIEYDPVKYAEALGYNVIKNNLTPGLYDDYEDVTYMAYCTTCNPYRALTDLGIFTSEPTGGFLPDNIFQNGTGYEACGVFTQADLSYYSESGRMRLMRRTHGYFSADPREGENDGWEDIVLASRGLYASGYVPDTAPLTLKDVVYSDAKNIPSSGGNNAGFYYLNEAYGSNTGNKGSLGTGWRSVHPLEQYYYDEYDESGNLLTCFNMGLGEYRGPIKYGGSKCNLYMYVRNEGSQARTRGKYVSAAKLVSSMADGNSYDIARLYAMQSGAEIVNLDAPIRPYSADYPDLLRESPVYCGEEAIDARHYESGCIYLVVSYSDNEQDALGSIRVLTQKEGEDLPGSISMQLNDSSTSLYSKSSFAIITSEGDDEEKDEYGNILPPDKVEEKRKKKAGIALYTTLNGQKINRLVVQQSSMFYGDERAVWKSEEDNVGEYFIPAENTFKPYYFLSYGNSIYNYIAAIRYEQKPYISEINIASAISYDGTPHSAAAVLGAGGFPLYINQDLYKGAIGSNARIDSAVIGVKRTSNVKDAIKDIKLSAEDLGDTFLHNDLVYVRASAVPIMSGPALNEPIYIYYTKDNGAGVPFIGTKITWDELFDNPDTDWAKVDWRKVDLQTIDYLEFQMPIHVIGEGKLTWNLAKAAAAGGLDAAEYAITNFGLRAQDNSITWSGIGGGTLINGKEAFVAAASTDLAKELDAKAADVTSFMGEIMPLSFVYTNVSGKVFDEELEEFRKDAGAASVFAEQTDTKPIVVLSGVFTACCVAAVVASVRRKRKKEAC